MPAPLVTVLVVDDSISVRRLVVELLQREGHRVLEAENGLMGYERAVAEQPDLVICDIHMPVLDGWGFLAKVRSTESLDTLPVLMLTTLADRNSVRRAMSTGADDFITKPWQTQELLDSVHSLLARKSRHRADADRSMAELRSAVLGTVPHELRTPLTSVLVLSQLLLHRRGHYDEAQVFEAIGRINRSAEQLSRTVGRMVDWSELNAAASAPAVAPPSLAVAAVLEAHLSDSAFIHELTAMVPGAAAAPSPDAAASPAANLVASGSAGLLISGHRLQVRLEPAQVLCLPTDLRRALVEVLGNALRFSQPGMPVRVVGHAEPSGRYALDVSNMGEPIPPAFVRRIGALGQADRGRREQQGAGLGLAISQLAMQRNGGHLEFVRLDGRPTVVRLNLGQAVAPSDQANAALSRVG